MKIRYQVTAVFSALVLIAMGALVLSENVSAAGEGKISGTVKLTGTPPHERPIDMSKEPYCQKLHASNPVRTENVVVGADGSLQWVVLYISEGLSGSAASQVPSEKPKWDQKGCQYIPHVIALDVNQHFQVTNSDPTSHNIHPMPAPGGGNNQWNKSQPPGSPPIDTSWGTQEVAIAVKCNIHPWMHGYMAVVKGPNAVSDEKGSYTIEGVPPGSYTVTAWQETLGTQTQKVTVAAGKPATADFTFKGK
jgi:Carboxypeptidase regulatory-like domain